MLSSQHYQAQAFHPNLSKQPASGQIRFIGQQLQFDSTEITIKFPLNGMKMREGGTDRLIFFSHDSTARCEVCTKDHSILQDPALQVNSDIAAQAKHLRHKSKKLWAGLAIVVVLIIAIIWGLFASLTPLSEIVANNIPSEWEQQLGKNSFEQIKQQQRILNNAELNQQLTLFTQHLTKHVKDSKFPFSITVVVDSNVNAFALPGGYIVINSGLITAAENGNEVLGVLAHEIAHVTRQHGIRNIIKSVGIYVLIQSLLGDSSGLMAVLADAAPMLITQKYSRDFEREADEVGLNYLITANINPDGMVSFFRKLQNIQQDAGLSTLENSLTLLSTHPATSERIATLQEKIENFPKTDYIETHNDFIKLKQQLTLLSNKLNPQ